MGAIAVTSECKGKSTDGQSGIGKDLRLFGNASAVTALTGNSFCIAWAEGKESHAGF